MASYVEPFRVRGSQFGATESFRKGLPHRGADWLAPVGSKIPAVTSGRVVEVYRSTVLGNCVVQSTADDKFVLYAHLASPSKLKVGSRVFKKLTKIGIIGGTGTAATGVHLHLGIAKVANVATCNFKDLLDPVAHIEGHRNV